MLSSINPLGERGRGQRFWLTTTWYVIGSTGGGLALGFVGGSLGLLVPDGTWRLLAIAIVTLAGAAMDLTKRQPPSWHRQVDENWLNRYRGWVYGMGFGAQLGFGLVTIVTSASFYSLFAVTILASSPAVALTAGAVFGLARALVILVAGSAQDPSSLRAMMRRLQDGLPLARTAAIGSQLLMAAAALMVAL